MLLDCGFLCDALGLDFPRQSKGRDSSRVPRLSATPRQQRACCDLYHTFTFGAFVQSDLLIQTYIHWWWWLPCKMKTSASEAVQGSVSFPRPLRHAHQGIRISDLQGTPSRLSFVVVVDIELLVFGQFHLRSFKVFIHTSPNSRSSHLTPPKPRRAPHQSQL